MVSCSQFLRNFSDYRDGLMEPAERALAEAHLAGCPSCASYERVVRRGISELQSVPGIDPSDDFVARLQYRLDVIDGRHLSVGDGKTSGASVGFVVTVAMLMAAAAWIPALRPGIPTVHLPPAVAMAPKPEARVHALFLAGPVLAPSPSSLLSSRTPPSLFSGTATRRVSAYQAETLVPR